MCGYEAAAERLLVRSAQFASEVSVGVFLQNAFDFVFLWNRFFFDDDVKVFVCIFFAL